MENAITKTHQAALADQKIMVKTTTFVGRDRIADTLCAALEGGSTYWCESLAPVDYLGYEWAHEAIAAGAKFTFKVLEEDEVHAPRLTIAQAVQRLADEYPKHFGDMVGETEDAETGDVLFQILCFGEIVYG